MEQLASVVVLMRPFGHVVMRLFLLQPLQDALVLLSDLHQLLLPCLSVETPFILDLTDD